MVNLSATWHGEFPPTGVTVQDPKGWLLVIFRYRAEQAGLPFHQAEALVQSTLGDLSLEELVSLDVEYRKKMRRRADDVAA